MLLDFFGRALLEHFGKHRAEAEVFQFIRASQVAKSLGEILDQVLRGGCGGLITLTGAALNTEAASIGKVEGAVGAVHGDRSMYHFTPAGYTR